jgi:hypothetical protein
MVADVMPITGSGARHAVRFCNFGTSSIEMLGSHSNWIEREIKPLIEEVPYSWVDLYGYASRKGDVGTNANLSQGRCDRVKDFIKSFGTPVKFPQNWGKGDTESMGEKDNNDGYWRAVDVYVYGALPAPPPRPVPPLEPGKPRGKNFRLRLMLSSGASMGLAQVDVLVFQVIDDDNKQCALFNYMGAGLTVAIKKIPTPPSSVGAAASWTKITASRPVELAAFAGAATVSQNPGITVGDTSYGGQVYLSFRSNALRKNPKLAQSVITPQPVDVPTGAGLGVGLGSHSGGRMSDPAIFKSGECCGAPGGVCARFK